MDLFKSHQFPSSLDNDQMEMMLMMMQFPELSSPQGNKELATFQPQNFSCEAITRSTNIAHTTMPPPNSIDDIYPLIPWSSSSSSPSYTNFNHLHLPSSTTTNFTNSYPSTSPMSNQHIVQQTLSNISSNRAKVSSEKQNSMDSMREMIYRMASMQPIHIDPESLKPPKRRNMKVSKDPQSVAARHRRERISERIRILQRLVPGGTKMDTASMLDEAIHYVKFLKTQIQSLERVAKSNGSSSLFFPLLMSSESTISSTSGIPFHHLPKSYQACSQVQSVYHEHFRDA